MCAVCRRRSGAWRQDAAALQVAANSGAVDERRPWVWIMARGSLRGAWARGAVVAAEQSTRGGGAGQEQGGVQRQRGVKGCGGAAVFLIWRGRRGAYG